MFWSLSFAIFLWLVNLIFLACLIPLALLLDFSCIEVCSFCVATWVFLHCCWLLLHYCSTLLVLLLFIFLALLFGSFYCCSAFLILLLLFSCCYLVLLIFVWMFQAWAPLAPMCATCFLLCCHFGFYCYNLATLVSTC